GMAIFTGCKPEPKADPDPDPEEYFSFYADGEFFDYPQEKGLGFGSTGQTLKAYGAGTVGYIIRGYSRKDPSAGGVITFYIQGAHIPDRDTVILEGGTPNRAAIVEFKHQDNSYTMSAPLTGKIIFTERSFSK